MTQWALNFYKKLYNEKNKLYIYIEIANPIRLTNKKNGILKKEMIKRFAQQITDVLLLRVINASLNPFIRTDCTVYTLKSFVYPLNSTNIEPLDFCWKYFWIKNI